MSLIHRRCLHACSVARSYIGLRPVVVPRSVTVADAGAGAVGGRDVFAGRAVTVRGPLGEVEVRLPNFVRLKRDAGDEEDAVSVGVDDPTIRHQRAMWGTSRALVANAVDGVTDGHTASLKVVGVGYRAAVGPSERGAFVVEGKRQLAFTGDEVTLRVGYAKPVQVPVPVGLSVRCPVPTTVIITGVDKRQVKQFAAKCRSFRPPEPYKGKGIFVDGETIRIKDKKGKK
ncbi:54S ribosomal protein L6 mitochondrial [Savitreella phatthalungensis]